MSYSLMFLPAGNQKPDAGELKYSMLGKNRNKTPIGSVCSRRGWALAKLISPQTLSPPTAITTARSKIQWGHPCARRYAIHDIQCGHSMLPAKPQTSEIPPETPTASQGPPLSRHISEDLETLVAAP